MSPDHVPRHGRHRDLVPVLALALAVVALFVFSLMAIVLSLWFLAHVGLQLVVQAMGL